MDKPKFLTVNVVIDGADGGTMETDIVGAQGKECEGVLKDLIAAVGDEKKNLKKPEYYKDNKTQVKQTW